MEQHIIDLNIFIREFIFNDKQKSLFLLSFVQWIFVNNIPENKIKNQFM
jgi:hypothetical protein